MKHLRIFSFLAAALFLAPPASAAVPALEDDWMHLLRFAPRPQAPGENLDVDESLGNSPYSIAGDDQYLDVRVGTSGNGQISQSAGVLTIRSLTLGDGTGSTGTYDLSGGTISMNGDVMIGGQGAGTFNHTGGDLDLSGSYLYLGYGTGGTATYNLGGTANLSTNYSFLGYGAAATFNQTGGTHTVNGGVFILAPLSAPGTYNLSGGTLNTHQADLGYDGVAVFTHSAGAFTTNGSPLFLARQQAGNSTYNLSGAGTLSTGEIQVGEVGLGTFNQTGGTVDTGGQRVYLGYYNLPTATGIYHLDGGTLTAGGVSGGQGVSRFFFNGGVLQAGATSPIFLNTLTSARIQSGGAIIDSNGFALSTNQILSHDPTLGATPDGGLTKRGAGTLTLTGVNTFTGPTSVNGGALALNAASGGTLMLSRANQINDAAPMTLNANSGPTAGATVAFHTGGFSETLGALTLSNTSIIHLGNGASLLHFANSSSQTWTGTLSIWNWTGTRLIGGGTDQVFFGTDSTGLTLAQLSQIAFYSDSGTTYLGFGGFSGSLGEVVPVPEAATWLGGALLLGVGAIAAIRRGGLARAP